MTNNKLVKSALGWHCPYCNEWIISFHRVKYCYGCGKKVDTTEAVQELLDKMRQDADKKYQDSIELIEKLQNKSTNSSR